MKEIEPPDMAKYLTGLSSWSGRTVTSTVIWSFTQMLSACQQSMSISLSRKSQGTMR